MKVYLHPKQIVVVSLGMGIFALLHLSFFFLVQDTHTLLFVTAFFFFGAMIVYSLLLFHFLDGTGLEMNIDGELIGKSIGWGTLSTFVAGTFLLLSGVDNEKDPWRMIKVIYYVLIVLHFSMLLLYGILFFGYQGRYKEMGEGQDD